MGLSHCSTTNDARTFIKKFDENIFPRFGTPRAIVSDEGTHLCNKLFANMTNNFGIKKTIYMPYNPHTEGLAEVSNTEIKQNLEKTVSTNWKD